LEISRGGSPEGQHWHLTVVAYPVVVIHYLLAKKEEPMQDSSLIASIETLTDRFKHLCTAVCVHFTVVMAVGAMLFPRKFSS
jgi:hypothetical protein